MSKKYLFLFVIILILIVFGASCTENDSDAVSPSEDTITGDNINKEHNEDSENTSSKDNASKDNASKDNTGKNTDDTAQEDIKWIDSWDKGFEEVSRTGKKAFLLLTAPSWCHWCQVLEENALSDPSVIKTANKNFVPIRILDTSQDINKVTFNFGGFPSMAFANDPKDILFQLSGAVETNTLLSEMDRALNWDMYLDKLRKEIEYLKDKPQKAYEYMYQLFADGRYKIVAEGSLDMYKMNKIDKEFKEKFLFIAYYSNLMLEKEREAGELYKMYVKEFPEGENRANTEFFNIVSLFYQERYEDTLLKIDEFKKNYPGDPNIKDVKEIERLIDEEKQN